MARPIPFARNSSHYTHIQNNLYAVLADLNGVQGLGTKPLWVSCRLNRSNTKDLPVFVGWVENPESVRIRVANGCPYSPGEFRFGDTNKSNLYVECLKEPLGSVHCSAWSPQNPFAEGSQRVGERYYNEKHRCSIPIKVNNSYVGTLNAAFSADPGPAADKVKNVLVDWAQKNSELVKYIKSNLEFSGPNPP